MTRPEILERLTKIIGQVLGNDQLTLKETATADDVPGWDSFSHINIIVGAEGEFGVKFNASELEEMKNVGDFVSAVEKHLSKKK